MTAVYRNYDQSALDKEYDNRTKVPGFDFPAFLKWCDDESKHARLHRRCNLDVSYGHGPAEKLDIFPAEGINSGRVEIFFHGGYWRLLDKVNFSYVANGLAPHGVTSVIVNYGLIPNVTMAELVDQCRAAVAWTYRHIAEYGGDPEQLYVSGHSAGGHLTAMMMATDWQLYGRSKQHELPQQLLKGACAISGIYELEPVRLCFLNATLNLTAEGAARFSPMSLVPTQRAPISVVVGGREGDEYMRQTREFAQKWTQHGVGTEAVLLPEEDHFSIRAQLGKPDSEVVSLLLRSRS
jgi:arylformamidase